VSIPEDAQLIDVLVVPYDEKTHSIAVSIRKPLPLDTPHRIGLFYSVDPQRPKVSRRFESIYSGEAEPQGGKHLRSIVVPNSGSVIHIYELP
jgi:hypothetical protein